MQTFKKMFLNVTATIITVGVMSLSAFHVAIGADTTFWQDTLKAARGQTVYFNAWGGSDTINAYIAWAGDEVKKRYGVTLVHVKAGAGAVVSKVLAEKQAGVDKGGSVDMVWINGENFKAMKDARLLYGPFSDSLPNYKYVDVIGKPTVVLDFTEPTEGLEAPWGMAKLVFMHDTAIEKILPQSSVDLLSYIQKNPGRVTFPSPPDFIGSTFLKQILSELARNPEALLSPAHDDNFDYVSAPLWEWLDAATPNLWRSGRVYPKNGEVMLQLLDDGEIDFGLSFNPGSATHAILNGQLPETVRTFVYPRGTIGNTHFIAIPYNASAKAGAKVAINFLMSPEAQIRKQNPEFWGDPTVLDIGALSQKDRTEMKALPLGIATLSPDELGPVLPEPHPSWMTRIEKEWAARYRQ